MRVGTLGAGMMTEALAGQWVRAGHEVMVGGRSPEKAAALARRIGARAGTLAEAAEFGDAVLLAVRCQGLVTTLEQAGAGEGSLAGKTVVDCGNAVDVSDFSLVTWDGKSLAEQAQYLAPGSHVVKAFNLAHAKVWQMTPPDFDSRPLAVPFAGDEEGKKVASRLIADVGCEPLDAGDLRQSRHLEAMAIVIIRLLFGGYDPYSVFAFVSPGRTGRPISSREASMRMDVEALRAQTPGCASRVHRNDSRGGTAGAADTGCDDRTPSAESGDRVGMRPPG